jgi:hypothetical protein
MNYVFVLNVILFVLGSSIVCNILLLITCLRYKHVAENYEKLMDETFTKLGIKGIK